MKKRLAARLTIASASLMLGLSAVNAADNASSAEKPKPIDPVAKPSIAKPSDALVPKAKEAAKPEHTAGKQSPQATTHAPTTVPQSVTGSGQTTPLASQITPVAPLSAPAVSQTPSGRPINDLKIMSGNVNIPKAPATPAVTASQAPSTPNSPPATDALEEKVRSLLQDRLGKDGEVVLRVSPDTPVGKSDSGSTGSSAKSRSGIVAATVPAADVQRAEPVVSPAKQSSDTKVVNAEAKAWDWRGPRGPQAWGRLDPSYAACSNGKMQSPPLISDAQVIASTGPALPQIQWKPQGFQWARQGPLWTANLSAGSSAMFRGQSYMLEGIQFRIPGEPFLGEKASAGAIHLIHRMEGRLLIMAVSLEVDDKVERQPAINSLLRRFPLGETDTVNWHGLTIDPQALLPKPLRTGVLFSGSLSYPPCTESVLWLLVEPPLRVPSSQLMELARLLGEGSRPLQAPHGRSFISIRGSNP